MDVASPKRNYFVKHMLNPLNVPTNLFYTRKMISNKASGLTKVEKIVLSTLVLLL